MGTTRIKVVDLSSGEEEIKTSRKHAEKLTGSPRLSARVEAGAAKLKRDKTDEKPRGQEIQVVAQSENPQNQAQDSETPKSAKKTINKKISNHQKIQTHHLGKKYVEAKKLIDPTKLYALKEALELLPKTSPAKFDATIETHLNVVDRKIRGNITLPHPVKQKTSKEKRYLIFSEKQPKIDGKQIIWADEKTIGEVASGNLKPNKDFDAVLATPKFMPQLASIAKILGPAGLMPNPKNQTVVEDVASALSQTEEQKGTPYQSDPTAPIIHFKLGKVSTKPQDLEDNLKTLYTTVGPTKIKKIVITSTMGPSIKIDPVSITSTAKTPSKN